MKKIFLTIAILTVCAQNNGMPRGTKRNDERTACTAMTKYEKGKKHEGTQTPREKLEEYATQRALALDKATKQERARKSGESAIAPYFQDPYAFPPIPGSSSSSKGNSPQWNAKKTPKTPQLALNLACNEEFPPLSPKLTNKRHR